MISCLPQMGRATFTLTTPPPVPERGRTTTAEATSTTALQTGVLLRSRTECCLRPPLQTTGASLHLDRSPHRRYRQPHPPQARRARLAAAHRPRQLLCLQALESPQAARLLRA